MELGYIGALVPDWCSKHLTSTSSRQHQQMVLSENRVCQNFMVIKCYNHHFPNFILMFPNFPYQICHFFGAFGAIWASSSRGHRGHRADGLTFSLQLLHKVGAQSTLPRTPGTTPGTPQGHPWGGTGTPGTGTPSLLFDG